MSDLDATHATPAGIAAALTSMSPQPMPLMSGQTFQCNRTASTLLTSVCSNAVSQSPLDPKGQVTKSDNFDASSYLARFEATREVFEREGFLTARIADIASTAGLSQGSFYHYFDSKEQIFREVAEAQERRLTAPADDGVAPGADDTVRTVIRTCQPALSRAISRRGAAHGRHRAGVAVRRTM